MAVLDLEQNAVVIRIVYDGPPEAGKTTSLRALSASLARPMTTIAEINGRTLYFDWLEYTGGLFEGRQIRCQVVTVPGQTVLAHRRRSLLETADVVVFVSDSAPSAVAVTRSYMKEMRATLDAIEGPPIGVIVQANKRDVAGAVDLPTLRAAMPESGVAVLESIATNGIGVRETFVFAVRLALDRVREMLRTRTLAVGAPEVGSSEELLRQLEQLEEAVEDRQSCLSGLSTDRQDGLSSTPMPPDYNVPSGMIWPPVEGRVLLAGACATPFVPRRSAQGDWIGHADGWRFHSPAQAVYTDPDAGRRALIEWARLHASGQRWFSGPRTVVLAASGDGTWRLWQIVKSEPTVREQLLRANGDASPHGLLRRLLDAGRLLLAATESLALAPCRLSITVDSVGAPNGVPLYVGFLPAPFLMRAPQPISAEDRPTVLRRELGALAATELRGHARAAFPPLRTIARASDDAAVIDALHDVLADAGLVDPLPV